MANKAPFVDFILEMGWWSEVEIIYMMDSLYDEVYFLYIILSYQPVSYCTYIVSQSYLKVSQEVFR